MKKIWLLLIIGLLLSACTSSQAEDAFITFCESIIEGDVDKALPLFTEEIKIYPIGLPYEGLRGVEDLVKKWSNQTEYLCEVKNFEVNGDEIEFRWNDSHIRHEAPEGLFEAKCTCSATMKEEKIDRLIFECNWEVTPIE